MIYLDNAATTKPCAKALNALNSAAADRFANAGSLHSFGVGSEKIIARAKRILLSKFGEGDVIFTSGATESNNTAILGVNKKGGHNIVTTAMEHPSVSVPINKLEENGFDVRRIAPKNSPDFERAIADAVDSGTVLVSCMAVNNETGFLTDVKKLYRLVKNKNPRTIVHIDAVQGFLKTPLDGDLISVSGHKIHAVKGIGALFVKKGTRLNPLLLGGGQQKNLRSGTEPVELIACLAAAVEDYNYDFEKFSALKKRLVGSLSALSSFSLNSLDSCLPNIINFSIGGVRSEIMLHFLEEAEIFVSSGSACSRGKKSGVLSAFGVSDKNADCAIRVSLCSDNSFDDIDALSDRIKSGAERFGR